jgi:hypothetical protein
MKEIIALILTLTAAGLVASTARADTTNIQVVPFHEQSVSGTGCPGSSTGYAYMTNGYGTMWITPPTNITSATFTDLSGDTSVTCVTKYPVTKYCATNPIPMSSLNCEFYIYVKSSGLTNGQPMTLQLVWH